MADEREQEGEINSIKQPQSINGKFEFPPSLNIVISDDDKSDPTTIKYVIEKLLPGSEVAIVGNSNDVKHHAAQSWPKERDLLIEDLQLPDSKGTRKVNIYGGFEQIVRNIVVGLPHNNVIVSAGQIPQLFEDFMLKGAFSDLVKEIVKDNKIFRWVKTEVIDENYVKRRILEAMNDGIILGFFPKTQFNDIDGLLPIVLKMYQTGDYSTLSMEERFNQINLNLLKPSKIEEA